MKTKLVAALAGAVLAWTAVAAELNVSAADTVETVLAAQKGKRVTLKMRSGQETGGTVAAVNGRIVKLSAVTGKEFYDAVVPLEAIETVLVRTKD